MEAAPSANAVGFGPFRLDLNAGELHKDGHRIRLQEQPFQILKMLLERPGEVVTREAIRQKLWPNDTIVEFDHSINAAIKKLRSALGGLVGAATLCGNGGTQGLSVVGRGGAGGG